MVRALTSLLTLSSLLCLSSTSTSPQFYPRVFNPHQFLAQRRDSVASGSHPTSQVHQNNYSIPVPDTLDPSSGPAAQETLKNNFPRQVFGAPPPVYPQSGGYPQSSGLPQGAGYPPQGSGFSQGFPPQGSGFPQGSGNPQGFGLPQIYRVDNLIIIANPPQPQPCIPQRPPYSRPPTEEDSLNNRFGDEPSKCTWAVVACCSPGSENVRYNCFELLGCVGFFFDNSACSPRVVMAAAKAALDFYRGSDSTNGTSTGGGNNNNAGTINNRI